MNPWNELVSVFHHSGGIEKIPSGSADNILLAWPPMLRFIQRQFPRPQGRNALDIECGAGQFCWKLHTAGFQVTGMDTSDEMVNTARRALPKAISLIHGDINAVPRGAACDLVTAIMVFQFIREIQPVFSRLGGLLKSGGLLVFAVFNPPFVDRLLNAGIIFREGGSPGLARQTIMELKPGSEIPVFIRSAQEYQDLLTPLGFRKLFEACPLTRG